MARGRHAKRSGLLSRLFPGVSFRRRATAQRERILLRELRYEVERVRSLGDLFAAEAAAAAARAERAEEQALAARAETDALRAETEALRTDTDVLRADTEALRAEVARLREELVWAWAAGKLPAAQAPASADQQPARVIDLREASGG